MARERVVTGCQGVWRGGCGVVGWWDSEGGEKMNLYVVVGRLSRDPELRESKGGTAICKLSVPTEDGWGERKKTTWHNIVCFGKTAEVVAKHKKKGDWVSCTGRLEVEKYTNRDGVEKVAVSLVAESISFVGNKVQGYEPDDSYGTREGEDEIPF